LQAWVLVKAASGAKATITACARGDLRFIIEISIGEAKMAERYRADVALVALWLGLTGIPVPISFVVLIKQGLNEAAPMIVASLIMPVLLFVFVSRFKVTFTEDEFIYRRWGPTIRIAYADIVGLQVTNVTPIERHAIGAFVVVKNGSRYPFWPKLFPKQAVQKFFQLGPLLR
jgi:hypothetical protein